MALTVVKNTKARGLIDQTIKGAMGVKFIPLTLTFDDAYAAGGYDFSYPGVNVIMNFIIECKNGYTFTYDYSNDKIEAFSAAATEFATTGLATALGGPTQALLIGY